MQPDEITKSNSSVNSKAKLKLCRILVAAVFLSTYAPHAAFSQQVQDLVARGVQAYKSRQFNSAVNNLQAAISRDPENDTAHYFLGNSLMAVGHTQHALQEYSRAFQYSMDGEMLDNCARVLEAYRWKLPQRTPRSRRSAAGLNPYSTGSLQQINTLAATRVSQSQRSMESHKGSLEVFKNAPESKDGMNRAWDDWILKYRYAFNNALKGYTGSRRRSGKTRMVFSVDQQRHLRGRIIDTDAPIYLTDAMLATTRSLDGDPGLSFPPGSQIPGFNFTMTYDYGAPIPDATTQTTASLRTTNTTAALRTPAGQGAVAGRLTGNNIGGNLSSTSTQASLANKNTSAGLKLPQGQRAEAGGALAATEVNGKVAAGSTSAGLSADSANALDGNSANAETMPLPMVSTDVSGLLLPKAKLPELKATPAKLLPGKGGSAKVRPKR